MIAAAFAAGAQQVLLALYITLLVAHLTGGPAIARAVQVLDYQRTGDPPRLDARYLYEYRHLQCARPAPFRKGLCCSRHPQSPYVCRCFARVARETKSFAISLTLVSKRVLTELVPAHVLVRAACIPTGFPSVPGLNTNSPHSAKKASKQALCA